VTDADRARTFVVHPEDEGKDDAEIFRDGANEHRWASPDP